jgi:hypothetical protein
VWSVYFHASDDNDWTLESYVRLADVSTVEDFWSLDSKISEYIPDNMFFMMREGVYPCWDDSSNMYGGYVSFKVSKTDACKAWELFATHCIGETMMTNKEFWESVTGVSISPKKYFSIVKIWLKDGEHVNPTDFFIPDWYVGEVLYRSHMDCIKANTEKVINK